MCSTMPLHSRRITLSTNRRDLLRPNVLAGARCRVQPPAMATGTIGVCQLIACDVYAKFEPCCSGADVFGVDALPRSADGRVASSSTSSRKVGGR